jgi:hypothetical protein
MEPTTAPLSGVASPSGTPLAPPDLGALVASTSLQLQEMFEAARWDGPVTLHGHPAGHMLAVPGFDTGLAARVLRVFAHRLINPWQGKSFGRRDGRDVGTNRVRLLGLRFTAFRFHTYETASVVDGAPALAIDYDTPETPAYARATYDELRPIAPGLLLGRGMRKRPGLPPKLLVWFALDTNRPDPDVAL